jgi:hypothetical protein
MRLETCIRKGLGLKAHHVRTVEEEDGQLVAHIDELPARGTRLSPSGRNRTSDRARACHRGGCRARGRRLDPLAPAREAPLRPEARTSLACVSQLLKPCRPCYRQWCWG